jgi:hypothetical protein
MREFLLRDNSDLSPTTPMDDIPCIWYKLMNKLGLEVDQETSKNRQLQDYFSQIHTNDTISQLNFQFHGKHDLILKNANVTSWDHPVTYETLSPKRRLQLTESALDDLDQHRPYTERQRKEIVIVLTQLLEIYRDDHVLAPILVSYVDGITQESGKSNFS